MVDLHHVADTQTIMFKDYQAVVPGVAGLGFEVVGDIAVQIHSDLACRKGEFGILRDFNAVGVRSARQGHLLGVKGTIFHDGFSVV